MKKIIFFLIFIASVPKIHAMDSALKNKMLKIWQENNKEQNYPVTLRPIEEKLQKKRNNRIDQEEKQIKKTVKEYKRALNIERNKKNQIKNYLLSYSPRLTKANL